MSQPRFPSALGYKVAGLVALAGALGAFAWFNYALVRQSDAVNELRRLPVRGTVEFSHAGEYTVWAGRLCGGLCRPGSAASYQRHLTVRLTAVADGEVVEPRPFPGSAYYNVGGSREGRAVWLLEIPAAGSYEVFRRNDGDVSSPPLTIGAGRGLPVTIRSGVIAFGGGGALIAGGLAVTTFARRRRALARRAARPGGAAQVGRGSASPPAPTPPPRPVP